MRNNTTRAGFRHVALVVVVAYWLLAQTLSGSAQQVIPPGLAGSVPDYLILGEAPTSLLQTKIGDAGVDLLASGSWQSTVSGSLAIGIHPDLGNGSGYQFPYTFPGMDPFAFVNSVDLTLSVWILDRYFFETTFIDQFALNTFLLGYQGRTGELVRKVLLGNTLMPFSNYPFLPVGVVDYGTAGATRPGSTAERGPVVDLHRGAAGCRSGRPSSYRFR